MISTISLGWLKSNGFVCMVLQASVNQWPEHIAFNGGRVEITSAIFIECAASIFFSIHQSR